MNGFLEIIINSLAAGGIGGFFGWFFTRKKLNAEAEGEEENTKSKAIDNEIKLSDYYQKMLDDLGTRYEAKFLDVEKLYLNKERILKDEILMLKQKVKMLKTENTELRKRVSELEKQSKNANQRPT